MPLHGLGQGGAFNGASTLHEVLGGQRMVDALDTLFDDWALIEICGHVVGRGANEFHAALVGLVVWAGTLEGWQEGVVNVDRFAVEFLDEFIRQNLHVAGQEDKLHIVLLEDFNKPGYSVCLMCCAAGTSRSSAVA